MRHRFGIAAAAALALVASATSPVSAQSDNVTIRDGSYGGFFSYNGGLVANADTIGAFVAAVVTGPADIVVVDGVVSGSATLLTEVDVSIGGAGGAGSNTLTAGIQGPANAPVLVGPSSLPMTVTYAGCSQVWGTWNEGFAEAVVEAGAEIRWAYGSFNFHATSETTSQEELTELGNEMSLLFDEVQFAMQAAEASGVNNRIPDLVTSVIDEVLRAQSELSIASPCSNRREGISDEQAATFLSQISTLLFDFVTKMLTDPGFSPSAADWTSIIGDLGRAGLLGSTSADPARAAELTDQIRTILEADLDLYVASESLAKGEPEAIATLRNALVIDPGMRVGAITAREAALVLGIVW